MKDLTRGSIARHVLSMAAPMAAGMVFQTLYYFVDLYFVSQLGDAAIAGVSAAGNTTFVILALTQVLGVGTVALISQAVGRKDQPYANLIFNQSLLLSALLGVITLVACYTLSVPYLRAVTADAATTRAGAAYLYAFGPGLALQFALVVMSSALRGTGIVKPAIVVQMLTLLLNALLAPVFIAGWVTHLPMGVRGAGFASSVAIAAGVVMLAVHFARVEKYVSFHPEQWQPRLSEWKRMLLIGLPAGGEFALIFLSTAITYWTIRAFGAPAQAGFGVGSRVLQGIFVPALAIAFAAAPIAGQNFGAGKPARVRETFHKTALIVSIAMLIQMAVCQWNPELLVRAFSSDAEVVRIGALFLRIVSWNFVAQGLIFSCSNMFQGLGNTLPSITSSVVRLVTYGIPAIWLSTRPGFRIQYVWYWSIVATGVQAITSLYLLRTQFRAQLGLPEGAPPGAASAFVETLSLEDEPGG
jgi:putative MATE family efflux protein